jgi:putative membrane protein
MMHWGNYGGMGFGGFGFGWLFMILFWVLLIIGIVYLVRYILRSSDNSGKSKTEYRETPEDIVRKRYASGEITKEEFEERMAVLKIKQ